MTSTPAKAPLRPRGEVRRLLLVAARELFAERGYAGTSTRAIAERAGVANSLLHRHFAGKAQLFQEAVFEPFAAYIDEVVSDWERRPPMARSLEDECRFFIGGLYDALRANRQLVLALIAGHEYESDVPAFTNDLDDTPIARMLSRLEVATETEIRGRGYELVGDATATVHLTFGMVLSAAVLPHWLMPAPRGADREELIEQMVTFLLHGIAYRP